MPDTKNQHTGKETNTEEKDREQQPNGKENVAKQVNRDKSQNKTDLHTKNKITGADLDAPPE